MASSRSANWPPFLTAHGGLATNVRAELTKALTKLILRAWTTMQKHASSCMSSANGTPGSPPQINCFSSSPCFFLSPPAGHPPCISASVHQSRVGCEWRGTNETSKRSGCLKGRVWSWSETSLRLQPGRAPTDTASIHQTHAIYNEPRAHPGTGQSRDGL